MELRLYHDPRCLLHENGPGHPERPERVESIVRRVESNAFHVTPTIVAPSPADRREIERVHDSSYVDDVEGSRQRERTVYDADTSANQHSFLAARLAAGGALAATRAAVQGDAARSFVAMRPPGHHAESDRAMGFCLFNNAAIAAADALASGLERVAIVDWDVHHGNGTEHIFAARSDVLYVSLHQARHYPGTGRSSDVGTGEGAGYTVNLPLPAGSGHSEYLLAFDELVLPILEQYRPQLVIVSAGFDGHERDPLAGMLLDGSSYFVMTARLREFADAECEGRIVHVLEGGYDLEALADGVDAVLSALAGVAYEAGSSAHEGFRADDASSQAATARERTRDALQDYWSLGGS